MRIEYLLDDKNGNEFHFDDEVEVGDDSWFIRK